MNGTKIRKLSQTPAKSKPHRPVNSTPHYETKSSAYDRIINAQFSVDLQKPVVNVIKVTRYITNRARHTRKTEPTPKIMTRPIHANCQRRSAGKAPTSNIRYKKNKRIEMMKPFNADELMKFKEKLGEEKKCDDWLTRDIDEKIEKDHIRIFEHFGHDGKYTKTRTKHGVTSKSITNKVENTVATLIPVFECKSKSEFRSESNQNSILSVSSQSRCDPSENSKLNSISTIPLQDIKE